MEKRTITKLFRCTEAESEEIRRRAEQERKSQSAYLRDAALGRKLPRFDKTTEELLHNLQENELKIGVNVNQAVRLCNSKKLVSRGDYERLTGYLNDLMELRLGLIRILEKTAGK